MPKELRSIEKRQIKTGDIFAAIPAEFMVEPTCLICGEDDPQRLLWNVVLEHMECLTCGVQREPALDDYLPEQNKKMGRDVRAMLIKSRQEFEAQRRKAVNGQMLKDAEAAGADDT